MIHDMDGFWPARPGSSKTLWNALSGRLRPGRLNGYLTAAIAVCLFTDDWSQQDWSVLMGWATHKHDVDYLDQVMVAYRDHEGVQVAAAANGLSVTRADGLDWVRVIARMRPRYRGEAPVWSRRALRDLREERGVKVKDLWRELDVQPRFAGRVAKWHSRAPSR